MSEEEFYNKLKFNFFGSKDSTDFKELVKVYNDKSEKLELYKSIINEFDKWLEEQENNSTYPSMIFIGSARYKLKELKGSNSNE